LTEYVVSSGTINTFKQRCSTRVQDLDSSPVFWDVDLRPVDSDLDLDLRPMDLDLDLDFTPSDVRLGLDTSGLKLDIFKVFLHFSLTENPDSQLEILNHLL